MIESRSRMPYYKQCKLVRGDTNDVAWVPEQLAKVGKILDRKDSPGWTVTEVYASRKPEDEVLRDERAWKGAFPSLID